MSEKIQGPCSERVLDSGRYRLRACSRKPTVIEEGKPWCSTHAPTTVAKREAAMRERWAREDARRGARWAEEAFAVKCAALVRAAGGTPEDVEAGRVRVTVIPCEVQTVEAPRHGETCQKAPHVGTGYLHDEGADGPYDVDGLTYCGRCHRSMD